MASVLKRTRPTHNHKPCKRTPRHAGQNPNVKSCLTGCLRVPGNFGDGGLGLESFEFSIQGVGFCL